MANEPGRDILPVKDDDSEKYCAITFRSTDERDFNLATTGNYTAKLDRNELENRYLRFVEENINLKKHCHNQEEKIKRLAAKLLRVVAEQRNGSNKGSSTPKYSDLEVEDLVRHVNEMERSNQLLREKLMVAGIQLSTHHPIRFPHKSPQRYNAHPTSRTDFSSRITEHATGNISVAADTLSQNPNTEQTSIPRNSCQILEQEVLKLQNQLMKYQKELETLKDQSNARIRALEEELAHVQEEESQMAVALSAASASAHTSAINLEQTSRRVAENVEIIKLQRNIKAKDEQIHALETERRKAVDDAQMLSGSLQALQLENNEFKEHVASDRKKISELQNELQIMKTNQFLLQDLQEEVQELQRERAILQEANNKIVQSVMDEGKRNEFSNQQLIEATSDQSICRKCGGVAFKSPTAEIQMKDYDSNHRTKDSHKIAEDAIRKEKEIEKRVKELEEELKRKVELEKEKQIEKEREEQRKREREMREIELQKQRALEIMELENLKYKVDHLESMLKISSLEKDKLEEDLKDQRLQIKDLELGKLKLSEKLATKSNEISELQKFKKVLTEIEKTDSSTQYEEENIEESVHSASNKSDCSDPVVIDVPNENSTVDDLINNKCTDNQEEVATPKDNNDMVKEKDVKIAELQEKLIEVSHNLEETEELLQEQKEINTQYKRDISKISHNFEETEELLREQKEMNAQYEKDISNISNELENTKLKCNELLAELKANNSSDKNESTKKKEMDFLPGLSKKINVDQCAFDLYIDYIILSEEGQAILRNLVKETSASPGIFLTWEFYEQEAAYTPIFDSSDATVDCSYNLVLPVKVGFLEYLEKDTLVVELHAAIEDISVPVAYAKLSFRNCVKYSNSKLCHSAPLISLPNKNFQIQDKMESSDGSQNCLPKCEFGVLHYQFGLNCQKTFISEYMEKQKEETLQNIVDDSYKNVLSRDSDVHIGKVSKEDEELDSAPDKNYEDESLSQKSLPKPAPRHLKASMNTSVIVNNANQQPQIVIEVHSFFLLPESSVARNPDIHQLFVALSFLGKQGEDMETPISLPKQSNEEVFYNFKKVFPMHPVNDAMDWDILKNIIHMKKNKKKQKSSSFSAEGIMQFNLVSEPLQDDDSDLECLDVGFAEISIPQILVNGEDIIEKNINVSNCDGSKEIIGYLNVSVFAIDVLHAM